MKYFLMGLKHFKNVAIACAPDNVGLAHELIGALRESEVMPLLNRQLRQKQKMGKFQRIHL